MSNVVKMKLPADLARMRAEVIAIEDLIRQAPQTEMPVRHFFSKGVYGRELFIPAGTVMTGKIHKHQNLCVMSQGDVAVLTADGVKRIKAPYTEVAPAGIKRIIYAHSDTIWTTFHGTEETDVAKIEAEFIAQDEAEYLAFEQTRIEAMKQLEAP